MADSVQCDTTTVQRNTAIAQCNTTAAQRNTAIAQCNTSCIREQSTDARVTAAPGLTLSWRQECPTTRRFSMRVSTSQAVRRCGTHFTVTSYPHPPTRPATAVRSSSAAGVTHLHEHDQFFSEKSTPCSAGTRPPFGRGRQLEGAGGKSLWLLRPAAANSMRHGYS